MKIAMDDDAVIPAPQVQSFSAWPQCPACALRGHGLKALWDLAYYGARYRYVQIWVCGGHKPPTETHEHPNPLHAMGGPEKISHEARFICAGLYEPHLHLKCDACNHSWLMATYQPVEVRL